MSKFVAIKTSKWKTISKIEILPKLQALSKKPKNEGTPRNYLQNKLIKE